MCARACVRACAWARGRMRVRVCVCVRARARVYIVLYSEVYLTLTEIFPCFFLSCKANPRAKPAKTGHGPHSSTLVVICAVRLLFVLFYVLFLCKCALPPGDNPTAANKYYYISSSAASSSPPPPPPSHYTILLHFINNTIYLKLFTLWAGSVHRLLLATIIRV
jgi:hypothetical protein